MLCVLCCQLHSKKLFFILHSSSSFFIKPQYKKGLVRKKVKYKKEKCRGESARREGKTQIERRKENERISQLMHMSVKCLQRVNITKCFVTNYWESSQSTNQPSAPTAQPSHSHNKKCGVRSQECR